MSSDAITVGGVTIGLWIAMTAVGVIVASINLWVARGDLRHQIGKRERRWERILIAKVNFTFEVLRVAAHGGLFVAGVMIAWKQFNPNPPGVSLYIRGVIMFAIAVLLTESLVHRWLRVRLTRKQTI